MNLLEAINRKVEVFRAPEVQDIFESTVSRRATIVVGGPGESPKYDNGLLWASHWVSPGGRVYIADPQSTGENPTREQTYDHRYVIGIGDVAEYQSYLSVLSKSGHPLAPVKWLGPQSTLWNMPGLPDNSVDHVMDHYTSVFLLHTLALPTKETKELWGRILTEYRRILRPGGTLLFQSFMRVAHVDGVFTSHEEILKQMSEFGFQVSHTVVRDGLRVPLSQEVFIRLHTPWYMFGPDEAKRAMALASYAHHTDGVRAIAPRVYYPCPDMYIGKKA